MRSQRESPACSSFLLSPTPRLVRGVTKPIGLRLPDVPHRILTVLRERAPELRAASHWEIE